MSQRIEKWDILKFFLMFFVVLGHVADCYTSENESMRSLYVFIYSFHMPLFIFVSGLFAKNTINNKRYSKIFGYLLMYVFSKMLFSIYGVINTGAFTLDLLKASGLPWYMFAMFSFMLLTISVRNVKPKYVLIFSILLALIVGYDPQIRDVLAASRIIIFFPFFYLGYVINPESLRKVTDKGWVRVISFVVIILAIVLTFGFGKETYLLRPMFTGRNPYISLEFGEVYGAFVRLGCYVISAILCFAFISITPNRTPFGVIAKFGSRTLAVYVFHYILIYLLYNQFHIKEFFDSLLPSAGAGYLVFPLAIIITVLFSLKPFSVVVNAVLNLPQKAMRQKQ